MSENSPWSVLIFAPISSRRHSLSTFTLTCLRPEFGGIGLWGIDELLTYHYLEAELFRSSSLSPERYWEMPKREQADAIWQALFVENSPLSEATRGVIAVLEAFDLPTDSPDLEEARSFFRAQKIESHVSKVLQMAGVSSVVMTNDPLHPEEEKVWMNGGHSRAGLLGGVAPG